MASPLQVFPPENPYGKFTIPGMRTLTGERRLRRVAHGRKEFFHRTKNGIYDPITYFHILDALLDIEPNTTFRSVDLVEHLNQTREQLVWDTTTVGRILNDISDSLEEANGREYLTATRRWNGMIYAVTDLEEGRTALVNLLDDLYRLCEALAEQEKQGQAPKRENSPLERCPSVALPG